MESYHLRKNSSGVLKMSFGLLPAPAPGDYQREIIKVRSCYSPFWGIPLNALNPRPSPTPHCPVIDIKNIVIDHPIYRIGDSGNLVWLSVTREFLIGNQLNTSSSVIHKIILLDTVLSTAAAEQRSHLFCCFYSILRIRGSFLFLQFFFFWFLQHARFSLLVISVFFPSRRCASSSFNRTTPTTTIRG